MLRFVEKRQYFEGYMKKIPMLLLFLAKCRLEKAKNLDS